MTFLNRIPIHYFRYFTSEDPLCKNSREMTKMEIMTAFMLINKISPELMVAWYLEGGRKGIN